MEHTSIPDPPGFSDLSKSEHILYLQTLWDRISEHPSDIRPKSGQSNFPGNVE